jgi:sirohydrochlorin cobaltochelatase
VRLYNWRMEDSPTLARIRQNLPRGCGLLLVGHGSREAVGVREFLTTADLVAAAAAGVPLEPCFLEFAQPTIPEGFRRLMARGAKSVVVVPVLLFSAGHARRDIPAAVSQVAAEFRGIAVWQAPHLGCQDELVRLSHERYEEAIAADDMPRVEQTRLVLVGRGSLDAEATAEMHEFAALRSTLLPSTQVDVGFVAMAEPKFTDVLDAAAASDARQIVVQPHLLFGGILLDRIRDTVADYARRHPRARWITAALLGPVPRVASAILTRAGETLSSPSVP